MRLIEEVGKELKQRGKPLTETWVMHHVMNSVSDEELYGWGSDIIDVAEKVLFFMDRERRGENT